MPSLLDSRSDKRAPRTSAACVPGSLLGGKYRLESLLAEGGMGNVWLARNETLDRPVALKIVRPDVRGGDSQARLRTEARVEANLQHPNVVRVFDYGETADGDAYIVMERLEGCTLGEWIERHGALAPEFAVQLMLPLIDALRTAHRAGVLHRDLKPENIFIAQTGDQLCPKVLDFGIAKLRDEVERKVTVGGTLLGSPAYMAPEQARGLSDVDERADVWALCVVMYEAISGGAAFDAANYCALLLAVIDQELAPLSGEGCAELWPILQRGLCKDRDQRIASMDELGTALARWLRDRGEQLDACAEPLSWHWSLEASCAFPVAEALTDRSLASVLLARRIAADQVTSISWRRTQHERHELRATTHALARRPAAGSGAPRTAMLAAVAALVALCLTAVAAGNVRDARALLSLSVARAASEPSESFPTAPAPKGSTFAPHANTTAAASSANASHLEQALGTDDGVCPGGEPDLTELTGARQSERWPELPPRAASPIALISAQHPPSLDDARDSRAHRVVAETPRARPKAHKRALDLAGLDLKNPW